jgi:O-antigen ligase
MLNWTSSPLKAPRKGRFLFALALPLGMLGLVALAAAWAAPNHYLPWAGFHGEAAAFAALCCLAAARALDPQPLRMGAFAWLALPLVGLIAAQWFAGKIAYGGDALLSAVYVTGASIAFWLGQNSAERRQWDPLRLLAIAVVAAAVLNVFIGVLQWHRLEQTLGIFAVDRGWDLRVFGNLAQPNHLATLCLMGIVLAWWLRTEALLTRWQCVLLVSWLSLGLTLTESRAGLAGAVAVGLPFLWDRRHVKGARAFVASWWAGLAAGHFLLPRLNALLYLDPARTDQLASDNPRLVMWHQAMAAIADAPWVGYGWRQTMLALKQAAMKVPGTLATDYAHNVVLDVLIWVGIPLGALLVGALAFWLVRAWRRIADRRQLFLFAAAVPVLVHSQFEFPFAYAYFLFPVAWLLGALAASQQRQPATRSPVPSGLVRTGALLLLGAYAVLCTAIALEYLEVEEDHRVMRFELRRLGKLPQGYEAPRLLLLTQLKELLELGRLEPRPGMSENTLNRLRLASERNAWATLDLTYVAALGLNGQPEEAARRLVLLGRVYGKQSGTEAAEIIRAYRATQPGPKNLPLP